MKSQRAKMLTSMVAALLLALILLPATAFADNLVTNVDITVTEPVVGQNPSYSPTVTVTPNGAAYLYSTYWGVASDYTGDVSTTDWEDIDSNTEFESGKYYVAMFTIKVNGTYFFDPSDLAVTVNNDWATEVFVATTNDGIAVYNVYDLTDGGTTHTHTYNPDVWSSNASQHWHECTDANCTDKAGSIKDVADHTFTWVVDREATATEEGLKHEVCTVCGFTRSENTAIAKIVPAEGTPKTGDATNAVVPLIALSAGAVVAGAAIYLKKKHTAE